MIDIDALKRLAASGASTDTIIAAAEIEEAALAKKREYERNRKRKWRARKASGSGASPGHDGTSRDMTGHDGTPPPSSFPPTPPLTTPTPLDDTYVRDARARDPDLSIREKAAVLASEVMTILGIDEEFIPPGWCGAPMWFEAGLRSGWKPEIVRIAAQRVAKTKRDGPPTTFRYLGKPIAKEHALAAAPIPTADLHRHPKSGEAHVSPDQRSVQDVARELAAEFGQRKDDRQPEFPLLRVVKR